MTAERVNGFAPIGGDAALGDGRAVALVARSGRIGGRPVPGLPAPPVCAGLLDPENGGRLSLCPRGPFTVERHYRGDSPILETIFQTDQGRVRVPDALTGPQSWTELVRRVE